MKAALAATLLAGCAAVQWSAAHAVDVAALKGAWIGVESSNPLKQALIIEHVEAGAAHKFSGSARLGSTGFSSKRLHLPVVQIEGGADGGSPQFAIRMRSTDIALKMQAEKLVGVARYADTGKERGLVFERATEESLEKAQFNRIPIPRQAQITVMYLGTPDCPSCRKWEWSQRPGFVASDLAKAVRFLEVKGATLKTGVRESDFPPQDQDLGRQVSTGQLGVPRFAVAVDREVVAMYFGTSYWATRIEPLARELVAWRASAN